MQKEKINQKEHTGPFDIIGDVHGCFDELNCLLEKLNYQITTTSTGDGFKVSNPLNRKVVFLGDLVDRGPKITAVLKLAIAMKMSGMAYCLAGNHDDKLWRKLQGRNVQIKHGLEESLRQLAEEPPDFVATVRDFLAQLPHHYLFDTGKLVVAHAGMKERYQGLDSETIRQF
ncbi:MAG TPA: metallophosphoesterase, partial [Bacillota bacterium]|nr:metallophosphoesterase [Bacillota bacterium]